MTYKDVLSNLIQFIMPISLFIIEFLTLISYYKGEYSDYLYYNLRQNWEETPITNIEITKEINPKFFDKKEFFKFAYFPGFKNEKGNYLLPSRPIYNILDNYFIIKKMPSNFNYPNIILNKESSLYKKCGIDSIGNSLYFDKNIECPINFIQIGNENDTIYQTESIKRLNLGNGKILYYSNKFINNKIITNLQLGLYSPAYKLESNHICDGFSCCGIVNTKEKNIIKQDDSSYQIIYSESISKILKNNGINDHIYVIGNNNFKEKSFKFWSKTKDIHVNSSSEVYTMDCFSQNNTNFNLYYRYYIGIMNLNDIFDKSLISQIIYLPKISKNRNFFEMIVILFIFIIYYALNVQVSKSKFNLGTILALVLVLLFSVINILTGIYIIIYHNKLVKYIINKLSDQLLVTSYANNKQKWFIILHIIKIVFNSINLICLILYLIIFIGLRKEFKKHCFTFFCCCRKSKLKSLLNPLMEEYEEKINKYEEVNYEKNDLKSKISTEENKKEKLKQKIKEKEDNIDVKISNLGIKTISETIVKNVKKDNKDLEDDIKMLEENKGFYEDYIKEFHDLSDREKNVNKKYLENLKKKEKLEKELKDIKNTNDKNRKTELENEIIELREKLREAKKKKK